MTTPGVAGDVGGLPPSLMEGLRSLWKDLPGLLNDRVELLSLELQRAGVALVQVVVLGVVAAIVAATAWLAIWVGAVLAMVSGGLHPGLAVVAAVAVNVAVALWALARARRLLGLLRLPATRRHLVIGSSAADPAAPDEGAKLHPPARA